ncbi:MAG TPA: carbohydrate kinase family protein [Dermatophilaceae bacterium]|nr:carbohydrate kinase family protein [Dermatophilaceae bacterium]
MRIVGGTYVERCAFPRHDEMVGSGRRAAATLADSGTDIILTSARHASEAMVAAVAAGTYRVTADWVDRSRPVKFSYFTPLNAPTIDGFGAELAAPIDVSGDVVLTFGLIETSSVKVTGKRVFVDPQRPRNLTADDLPDVTASQTIWTLNERETRQLGGTMDVEAAARKLIDNRHLAAVVTKRGPRGVLVTTAGGPQEPVGACITETVFPIGSGDVFAAAFAWSWVEMMDVPLVRSYGHDQPVSRRNQSLPASTRGKPGGLVGVGTRVVRGSEAP